MRDLTRELYEALRWLVNLHNGVSKGGRVQQVSNAEWFDALEHAESVLREYESGQLHPDRRGAHA